MAYGLRPAIRGGRRVHVCIICVSRAYRRIMDAPKLGGALLAVRRVGTVGCAAFPRAPGLIWLRHC